MPRPLTHKQAIRRGRSLRRSQSIFLALSCLLGKRKALEGQRVVFETETGPVPALCYGWDDPQCQPLVIDLHGGGFIMGGAAMDKRLCLIFRRELGCKVISIDYPKAPDHPYPAAVNAVYAVVKHVVEKAEAYAIDPERLAIGGHSAGGTLAAVTCMQAQKKGGFSFRAQILDYPAMDLATNPFQKPRPKGCISPRMAEVFNGCYVTPEQAREPYASPLFARVEDLRGLPPALLIVAGMDSLHDEGLAYGAKLQAAGVPVQVEDYPNALHGFTAKPSDDTRDAVEKMVAFLRERLRE